jgi:hypothetical protein
MAKRKSTASKTVASAMRRRKSGTLKSGSGRRVRSRKQAIAIGLSEARAKGADVPPPPGTKRGGARKKTAKRSGASSSRSSARKRSSKTSRSRS